MQTLSITYVTTIFTIPHIIISCMSQLLCKGVQKLYILLGEWCSLKKPCCWNQNMLSCVRCVGGNLWVSTKKKYVYFLFKYSLVHWRWGVQSRYLSSRSYILMTGKFLLGLSNNYCFYKTLSPGRSKTYVTFDMTEEYCTWSLTASNVCDYWNFQ